MKDVEHKKTWDNSSCVRNAPHQYTLHPSDIEKDLFPRDFVGTDIVEKVFSRGGERSVHKFLAMNLIDFMDYTEILEQEIVNPALCLMARGSLSKQLPEHIVLSSLQTYTDEGYHAYFSRVIAVQARNLHNLFYPAHLPKRIQKLRNFLSRKDEVSTFIAALTSETLISKELNTLSESSLAPGVFAMLADHAKDETFHASLFLDSLEHIINHQPKSSLPDFVKKLKSSLDIFFEIDHIQFEFRLKKIGLSSIEIQKASDVADHNLKLTKIERCSDLMRKLSELTSSENIRIFKNNGYL